MLLRLRRAYADVNAPLRLVRHCIQRAQEMRQTMRGRRALAAMDARMLADIGVSRAEVEAEINRKPWDIAPR